MNSLRRIAGVTASTVLIALAGCSSDGNEGSPAETGPKNDAAGPTESFLTQANLERITAYLASDELQGRDEGSPGGVKARQFLIDELKTCAVAPAGENGTFEQRITTGKGVNVLGTIQGTGASESARTVLLSAHYDHLGVQKGQIYRGAYDNAAAVALVVGVACELARKPPLRSVLVALWDAEEPETFLSKAMGSQFYVDHPLLPLDRIDVAIVLDLIAGDIWPGAGLHFALGAEKSTEVLRAVKAAKAPAGLSLFRLGMHLAEEQPLGHQPWSDYDAFRNAGVPYLFLTDAQTKVYHTPDDTMDNLVKSKLPLEASYLHSIAETLARAPESDYQRTSFAADAEDHVNDAETVTRLLELSLAPGGMAESLRLSAASKSKLKGDLTALQQVKQSLTVESKPTAAAITAMRRAAQRMMCLAGSTYPETLCVAF